MPIRPQGPGPYAPPRAILDLVHAFRARSLPTPFDLDVLQRAGISASLAPRVLQSLKLLDLVDDNGNPLPILDGLRRAPESEFQDRLAEAVRAAYEDVFQYIDPTTEDPGRIMDQFRQYEPIGQLRRMVTLFTGLCRAAGIMPEDVQARPSRPASRGRRGGRSPVEDGRRNDRQPKPDGRTPRQTTAATAAAAMPPAIAGLLATIPANGSGWTKEERDRFLATFTAVLDYSVPIRPETESNDNKE